MKPSEKITELRGDTSRPKFAKKYGVEAHTIKYIEEGRQSIPDELALALEREYKIPFKWWKTGEGPMDITEGIPMYEDPETLITEELKEHFDYTENEAKTLISLLRDKEVFMLLGKALKGDSVAKKRLDKIIGNT